jgi:phage tail sheath protein FI
MPDYPANPDGHIQEFAGSTQSIVGVPTSVTAFVGYLRRGPINEAVQLLNFGDFQRVFGDLDPQSETSWQISQYFLNGGTEAWVTRVVDATSPPPPEEGKFPRGIDIAGSAAAKSGLHSLDELSIVNLLCAPDLRLMDPGNYLTTASALLNYALQRRAFAILDLPQGIGSVADAATWMSTTPPSFGPGIISAAAYYPEVEVPDPTATQPRQIGVSGTMAGLYGTTDGARGVWKAPAGITAVLTGVQQLAYTMTDQENGILNPMGINALRTFPVYGNVSWGAGTLASPNPADDDWKYINVRRLTLFIEQSVIRGLQWVEFEPNDETLWAKIRMTVNSFLHPLFQQGAFAGSTPAEAYHVICDASTTTAEDIDNGIVNLLVLIAPAKPAEFVVISIQQMAGQSSG